MTTEGLNTNQTVNEIIGSHPETVEVFNRLGIDACCGGDAFPREAAVRDGVDAALLLRELDMVVGKVQ